MAVEAVTYLWVGDRELPDAVTKVLSTERA